MNITVTDQPHCKKQLRIEISGDQVREETDKIAEKYARQIRVPGFRPGHVPKSVIKTRFRKELRDEVVSNLLPHSFSDAIVEKKLRVVGEPSVENLKFGDDESIDVTFAIEVAPEFELANYKSLPITKRVYKVTDEDVGKTVEKLRESQAELVPVEDRGAQTGDIVTVNLTGRFEPANEQAGEGSDQQTRTAEAAQETAEPVSQETTELESASDESKPAEEVEQQEEVKQQDVEIELGAEGVLKEFTEALTGVQVGDERAFVVEYPADYKPERFAGRRVNYTAEVTAVRVTELPEPDDEFAQSVSDEAKTIGELRADIRKDLEYQAGHRTQSELRNSAMEQIIDRNRFDVPDYVVEKQIDSRIGVLLRNFTRQGIDPRRLNFDWDKLRETQRERAARDVRASFILERIAETENIEAGDDEINDELEQHAASTGQDVAALRARLTKEGGLDSIKEQVKHRKALDLVIASADIRIEEVEGLGSEEAVAGEGEQSESQGGHGGDL